MPRNRNRNRNRGRKPATSIEQAGAIRVQVDIRTLTFNDLVLLEDMEGGIARPTMRQLRDMLDRAVVGGVGSYTLEQVPQLVAAIRNATKEAANPKT